MTYGLLVSDRPATIFSDAPTTLVNVIYSDDGECWRVIATASDRIAGLAIVRALNAQAVVYEFREQLEGGG